MKVTEVLFPPPSERWSGEKGSERKPGQNGVTKMFHFFSGGKAVQPNHGMAGAGGVFWGNQKGS